MIGWIFTVIIGLILWRVYRIVWPPAESMIEDPVPLEIKQYTPRTLAPFNGVTDPHVLIGVRGKVYDVTAGKQHYGPGGPYEFIAGRDASRNLAKHSFEAELLTPLDQPLDPLADLTKEENEALDQWQGFFSMKYTYCGELIDELK